ncbi:MAG: hypothetical protein IJ952_01445, partial [Alistipes sp.]|nr:hypothetical protein [Alistipes sp.]
SDIREKKLEEIKIRAQRASYNNIRYAKWNDAHKMQFDGVLTDQRGHINIRQEWAVAMRRWQLSGSLVES